jgi:alcohol dehydrogenase (cytochrome c)
VWDVAPDPVDTHFWRTSGPLIANGRVIFGTGVFQLGGNYVIALDAETGSEVWRFATIPSPGQPGGNSWNGLPREKRSGAAVWTPGSYDPDLNLVFFGPGNTYDTKPIRDRAKDSMFTNDALYTDTTLALNADTGELVWSFQHFPNDQWDLDGAFERQILTLPIEGKNRKVIVTAGKVGIHDVLDAATGKYLFSIDLGLQNLVTAIDRVTGKKTVDRSKVPGDGEVKFVCPHVEGGKNWTPSSYNPNTYMLYVAAVESCMTMTPVAHGGRGLLSTGVDVALQPRPGSDGRYGRLEAVNLKTRKSVWVDRQRAPLTSGTLATAGGLVFVGYMDRIFAA